MTDKIKKIIAREGLIILAIILLTYLKGFYHVLFTNGDIGVVIVLYGLISLFLCTTYLLINGIVRFIIWAIRTLRKK